MTHSKLARMIDHTLLKADAPATAYQTLFAEAREYGFFSVCVPPAQVVNAREALRGSEVKVCTVIGFPLGYALTDVKAFETTRCIDAGADEIDMVLNVAALKSGDLKLVEADIAAVVAAAKGRLVKVILETCYLTDAEKVQACKISENAGALFVKTSTGFGPSGATEDDVRLMRQSVSAKLQVKASGGIRDTATALKMIEAGATRLGTSASVHIVTGQRDAGSASATKGSY